MFLNLDLDLFLIIKTIHIVLVTSWLMGLLYAPRILVNYAEEVVAANHLAVLQRLALMARRLLKFSTVLAIIALLSGGYLWLGFGLFKSQAGWLHLKLVLVMVLVGYHHGCYRLLNNAVSGKVRSVRWYKLYNEIPIILMTLIVSLVLFKPNIH